MFSQKTEYALRIMVYLASLEPRTPTIPQIAAATQVPAAFLAKILRGLALSGLIRSQRGIHGGSTLAKSAEQITVYDVIQAVDPLKRITSCPLGLKNHGVNLCPLHRRLDEAIAAVEQAFRKSTLADMVADPSSIKPLVDEIPTEPATGLVSMRVLKAAKKKKPS
jgi:Rrf2 family protein